MKREKRKPSQNIQKKTSKHPLKEDPPLEEIKIGSKTFPFNIWVLIGLILTIGIIAFSKYLTGEYLFFFNDIGSDTINQNYPGIVHRINLMSEGFFSKWSFYKGMGQNHVIGFPVEPYAALRTGIDHIGAMKSGADYFVYGRFLRIFIFDFLLSGIIFYLYLRTLSIKKFASVIGGLLIAFSGYMVVGSAWGFSSHIFKAVFLLFSFEQTYLKKRWYFFPIAIVWLSSNVFVLFNYTCFLLLYSLFRFFSDEENKLVSYFKLALKMVFLGLVGILMNIGQVSRSFLKMYNSPRVMGNASYSDVLSSGSEITEQTSLGASTLMRFFSSDILGTGSDFQGWNNYLESPLFYIGILTLLIFPQVFIHLNKRKKIIFSCFLGFWILTLFVPYLRYSLLAFTGDYFRYGFDFFIPFTLLLYAVFSLNELDKNLKINYKLLIGTIIMLLFILLYPYIIQYKTNDLEIINNVDNLKLKIKTISFILIILYGGLIYLISNPKFKFNAQIGLVFLLIFELSYFSYLSYEGRVPITKREFKKELGGYKDGTIKAIKFIKSIDKTPFYRTEKDYQSGSAQHSSLNDALAQAYFGTTGYSSFNQLNYVRFLEETGLVQKGDETATRWLTGLRGYPLLQTFGNIKYHLSKSEYPEFLRFGFDSLSVQNGITILKNRYYLPFGYTYDKYIESKDFKKLTAYQITGQSLNTIYQDLARYTDIQTLNQLINNLQSLLNVNHPDSETFNKAITNNIGDELADKFLTTIRKYSVSNFKNQTALLNGFVYEKEFQKDIDLSKFMKINLDDTINIIAASKFNLKKYEEITAELKQDTLQITSFKQASIKAVISLEKPKMLFLTIPFDDAWKIKVNNKDEQLLRINYGFTGIILPEGEHKIDLYYVPKYSRLTNTISLITIVGFWLYISFLIFKKRRAKMKISK